MSAAAAAGLNRKSAMAPGGMTKKRQKRKRLLESRAGHVKWHVSCGWERDWRTVAARQLGVWCPKTGKREKGEQGKKAKKRKREKGEKVRVSRLSAELCGAVALRQRGGIWLRWLTGRLRFSLVAKSCLPVPFHGATTNTRTNQYSHLSPLQPLATPPTLRYTTPVHTALHRTTTASVSFLFPLVNHGKLAQQKRSKLM